MGAVGEGWIAMDLARLTKRGWVVVNGVQVRLPAKQQSGDFRDRHRKGSIQEGVGDDAGKRADYEAGETSFLADYRTNPQSDDRVSHYPVGIGWLFALHVVNPS